MKTPKPRKLSNGNSFIYLRLGGNGYSFTAPTDKEVTRKAALFKAEYLAGVKRRVAGDLTLREAIEEYISAHTLSPSSVVGFDRIKRTHFTAYMDKKISFAFPWEKIITEELKHYAVKTEKNAWGFVKSVLRANKVDYPEIRFPDTPPPPDKYLTAKQITLFLEAVKDDPCELGALLALHSLRASEVFAVSASDYDPTTDVLTVQGAIVRDVTGKRVDKPTNKNRSSARKIRVMIPRLRELLIKAQEANVQGHLVTCAENTLRRHINKACAAAGVTRTGTHGLRHTFASLAHHVRLSELEAMKIGGWSDRETMHKIYQHLEDADRLAAENKMAAWYEQNVN